LCMCLPHGSTIPRSYTHCKVWSHLHHLQLGLALPLYSVLPAMFGLPFGKKKKKDFTSFCQPTQPIACAKHGNHVQIIMKSRQSTT